MNMLAKGKRRMKPIFILGVGAQKAGTSWLHNMFERQKYCNMGFRKEYHIWDAKLSEHGKVFVLPLSNPDIARHALRRLMQNNDDIYGYYFKSLITETCYITGDITPSYAFLNFDAFEHIKQVIEGFGFDLKVIFLMRDPVDRIWSGLRMHQKNKAKKGIFIDDDMLVEDFMATFKVSGIPLRSNYKLTMKNIEAVFSEDAILYAFYENLFTRTSIDQIDNFLGIKLEGIDFEKKINQSPEKPLPDHAIEYALRELKEQYMECNTKFPVTRNLWRKCI